MDETDKSQEIHISEGRDFFKIFSDVSGFSQICKDYKGFLAKSVRVFQSDFPRIRVL